MPLQPVPVRIAPSFFPAADLANLASEIARVEPGVDMLHVDVMDGHFVPNLTIGPPVVAAIRRRTRLFLDCHLMMTNPGQYLEAFKHAGADSCSVHLEAGSTRELIAQMRELKIGVGLAVKPDTQFDAYEEFLGEIDMLVVMTVEPGFGGQSFMEQVMPKLRRSRQKIDLDRLDVRIEVDGGINTRTALVAAANGADSFVAGAATFGADDPADAAIALREAIEAVEVTRR